MKTRDLLKGLIALMVMLIVIGSVNAAEIWTDQRDYQPEDTVLINGSGFSAATVDNPVRINVTRPLHDGVVTVHQCPNETWCPNPLPTTSDFSGYTYTLDGIEGTYTIVASDGTNTAVKTFTDSIKPLPEPILAIAAVMALAPVIAYGLVRRRQNKN